MTKTMLIPGSVWWSSDGWLRQAAVVHLHLRLVQPRPPHRRLQVLWGLRHPRLPQPGGVHGVHLLPAPPGHTNWQRILSQVVFSICRTFLRCLVCTPTRTSPTRSTRQQGSSTRSWRCNQRTLLEVGRGRAGRGRWSGWQKTCSGGFPSLPFFPFIACISIVPRKLPEDYSPHEVKEAIEVLGGMQPMNIFLRWSLNRSWTPLMVVLIPLVSGRRLTACNECWVCCVAPWQTWWWQSRARSSWATISKKFSTTCLMPRCGKDRYLKVWNYFWSWIRFLKSGPRSHGGLQLWASGEICHRLEQFDLIFWTKTIAGSLSCWRGTVSSGPGALLAVPLSSGWQAFSIHRSFWWFWVFSSKLCENLRVFWRPWDKKLQELTEVGHLTGT